MCFIILGVLCRFFFLVHQSANHIEAGNGKVEDICAMPRSRLDHNLRRACERYTESHGVLVEASNTVYGPLHATLESYCQRAPERQVSCRGELVQHAIKKGSSHVFLPLNCHVLCSMYLAWRLSVSILLLTGVWQYQVIPMWRTFTLTLMREQSHCL